MNCDILKIVRGNDFATQMTITALDAGGNVIKDFSLEDSTDVVVKYTLAGNLHEIEAYDYEIEGNDITIQWSNLALGKYGFEIEGKFNGYSWRSAARFIFQIVADNASANIPDGVLVDGVYKLSDWLRLLSGTGGGIKQVQANWDETDTKSPAYIQNKPNLAPVATSGSYNDLTDKPTIPSVTDKADKVSGAVAGDFAALDANGNLTDSGKKASDFATAEQGAKADTAIQDISGKQDVLVSGENIKTINNESILGSGNITIEGGGDVESVNGKTGVVVLDAEDVGAATAAQGAKADTALQPTDIDDAISSTSENPVQNKVVKEAIDDKLSEVIINAIPAGSIAIIDDCTTGGSNNALSAQQGKVLNERINEIAGGFNYETVEEEVTTDVTMTTGKYIQSNQGVGDVCPMEETAFAGCDCAIVNLNAGETLDITGVGGNSSRLWAILDKTTHQILSVADASTTSPAAPYFKQITATIDCIVVINVYNADASPAYGNSSHTPYSVKITRTEEVQVPVAVDGVLKNMQDEIDELNNDVLDIIGGDYRPITENVTMTIGKYIQCNQGVGNVCPMTETTYAGTDCAIVNLNSGDSLDITGVGGNGSRLWAVLDKTTHVILSVADANTIIPQEPFHKEIVATQECIVIVNVYNIFAQPPYGNNSQVNYSVKITTEGVSGGIIGGLQTEIDSNKARIEALEEGSNKGRVFPMTTSMPSTASEYDSLWNKFVSDGLLVRSTIATPQNKPVYLYRITPYNKIAKNPNNTPAFTISDNDYFQKKKLLILAGVHGDERQTPLWLYEFINRMLYNDQYAEVRATYDWYVVPMVNPTGYDADTRNNYNNVNINRDFNRKTQVETQAICDLIDNGGFDMFLDCHQLSGGSGKSDVSPLVCSAFICASGASQTTVNDLCVKYTRGGSKSDCILNAYFDKDVAQSCFAWPPVQMSGDDLQSHEYAFSQGVNDSFSFEFTQYAYPFSGSDVKYNGGSMVYGNTVFHYLMMEFLQ